MQASTATPAFTRPDWSRLAKEGAIEGARARYELRAGLRDVTTSDRTARCGVSTIAGHDDCPHITLTSRGDGESGYRAKWRGVLMCGRIWCCPVCSAKKRATRALAVDDALSAWGGLAQMATLTVRHLAHHTMAHVFGVLRRAWRKFKMGGRCQRLMREHVKGSIRAWEVTRGPNGWHPHIHVLWMLGALWDAHERHAMEQRWIECVRSVDPSCVPNEEHALVWSDP